VAAIVKLYRLAGYPSNGLGVHATMAGQYIDGTAMYNRLTSRGALVAASVGINRGSYNYGYEHEAPVTFSAMRSGVGIFTLEFDIQGVYRLFDVKLFRTAVIGQGEDSDTGSPPMTEAATVYIDTPRRLFKTEPPYYHTNSALLKPRVVPLAGASVTVSGTNGINGVSVMGVDLRDVWPYDFRKTVNVGDNQEFLEFPAVFLYNSTSYVLMEARRRVYAGGAYGFSGPWLHPGASSFTPTHLGIVIPDDTWEESWTQPGPNTAAMSIDPTAGGEELPLTFPIKVGWDPLTYKSEIMNREFEFGVKHFTEPVLIGIKIHRMNPGEGSIKVPIYVKWREVY